MEKNRMKKLIPLAIVLVLLCAGKMTSAQSDSTRPLKTYKVGVFAPLYLDSVFTPSGNYKYRENFPKFILPGLDFIHGAQIAFDSMKCWGENFQAYLFDTKSYGEPISVLIKNKKLDSLNLIIGSVKDAEFKQLADFAALKKIPFISATLPNDGGITNNPYLVIVNSTLKAHCEAIFSYLLQKHGTDAIYLFRQKGAQEDRVAGYFKAINEPDGKPLLNIRIVNIDSNFSTAQLRSKLDSNQKNLIIGGSLDENFAVSLATACSELPSNYSAALIGMPNWYGFKGLLKRDSLPDFHVYFTTPYFNSKSDSYSKMVINGYARKYKGKPTDLAFKGFECTYLFCKLLSLHPNDLMNHLNDKTFKLYTDFNFKAVYSRKDKLVPDYYENKHLYFNHIFNGVISKTILDF